ncbi:hypothetical protein [Pseudomonas fulva]|uniref:hypothetical protein n=1 Tax=Pseudomonas fulva TaxID=47880 RepID=UPI0015F70B13|nr:hypothetical protein [Pseudomonas fulva]
MPNKIRSGFNSSKLSVCSDWVTPEEFMVNLKKSDTKQEFVWHYSSPVNLLGDGVAPKFLEESNNWLASNRLLLGLNPELRDRVLFVEEPSNCSCGPTWLDAENLLTTCRELPILHDPSTQIQLLNCWFLYETMKRLSLQSDINLAKENDLATANLLMLQERLAEFTYHEISPQPHDSGTVCIDQSPRDEMEIVTSQLLHAQTVIESYHNLTTDMIKLLAKTEASMTRAREVMNRVKGIVN